MAPVASLLRFAVAALVPPVRNVARDGPGPPADPESTIIAVSIVSGVLLLLTLLVVGLAVSARRQRARFEATRATGIGCGATVVRVVVRPTGNHDLSLRVSMPAGAAGTAGGVFEITAVVRFASDEAKARVGPGATIPVRVSRDAPLTLLVEAPGVETLA
jgi:hypothetical protein